MVDIKPRSLVTCACGKTLQLRNLAHHCSSKSHTAFANKQMSITQDKNDDVVNSNSSDHLLDLTAFLRNYDLRADQDRIRVIVER
ncbi:unnamed protein product, partial [Rotaria magnacalcarata]